MDVQQIIEMLKAYQEKADANRKAFEEKMDTLIANIKIDQKETTDCQEVTRANPETIGPNPGEKETSVKQQEIPNEEAAVHSLKECRSEKAASQEDTEKPDLDSGMMQSAEEHQEFTQKDAVVKPVKGRKKRRRARKPAAGRHGDPKELTQSDCGSGKHLATDCRKVSGRATVAWRKRSLVRKIEIQDNCEPWER
jgi:hypothetical protein